MHSGSLTGYFHSVQPKSFGRCAWTILGIFTVLMGIPSLWAPFDGDQALFYVTGQKILAGEILYTDAVDLKPPLIYFIYAGAIAIFGESVIAVRLVELVIQFVVVWVLVQSVRRVSRNDLLSALAGVCYAALYFGLPYSSRGQVEGFACLPIALIVLALSKSGRGLRGRTLLSVGLLIGILVILKSTFLALLPTIVLLFLFDSDVTLKRWFRRSGTVCFGVLLSIIVAFAYLWTTNAFGDYLLVQEFVKGYASVQWSSLIAPLDDAIRQIPWYFVTTYSVMMALLTIVGAARILYPSKGTFTEESKVFGELEGLRVVLRFALLATLVLLATVGLEAKYLTWHFNRLFVPGAILSAWGAFAVLQRVATSKPNKFCLFTGVVCLVPLLLLSPLVRNFWNNRAFLINGIEGIEAFNAALGMNENEFDLQELKSVGEYLRTHRESGGKIFVASGWGGSIHFFAEDVPDFKVYHSGFLIAPYAPEQWRQETRDYLLHEKPQFVVAQVDAMAHITGTETTSHEMLLQLPGVDSLLQTEYRPALTSKMTIVYERVAMKAR